VINQSIARRYALALLELVEKEAGFIAGRLTEFQGLLKENPIFKEVLISPAFRMDERKAVFDRILLRLEWGPPLDRFLWYLVQQGRMAWLDAVVKSFIAMVDEKEGRIRVEVATAQALPDPAVAGLKRALAEGLKKEIIMQPQVDAQLLAGVKVKVGDLVVDGSLQTQLNNLEYVLKHPQG